MSKTADVLIIGGGHTGLYAACRLAEAGYSVRLFDQKKEIGQSVVCTGIIGIEAFSRFHLPQDTILGRIQNVRFHSPFGASFHYQPDRILAWVVDRTRFNKYFEAEAIQRGVEIITNGRVESIHIKKEGVSLRLVSTDNAAETTYEGKVVILATGVNYKLFEWVGLEPPEHFLGGAQIHIPYDGEDSTGIYVGKNMSPGAFAWVVPLQTGVARVGLLSEKNPAAYLKKLLDVVKPGWRDDVRESLIDLRPVVQSPIERSTAERVMVIGEAAGQIKTTTGGGIFYGLLGAQMAVDTLKDAFKKNNFSAKVLGAYDHKWKKAIGEEIRFGYYFRKLFAKLNDDQIEEFFDRMSQEQILNLAHREADFDWHKNLIMSVFKLPVVRKVFREPF